MFVTVAAGIVNTAFSSTFVTVTVNDRLWVFPSASVIVTVILVQSVNIFNDFVNPLYFLPGEQNATVQLTLFNFSSQFVSQYNLLFMDILLITIPPLILYIFFNRQIVAGMTSGAVKG